MEIITAKYLPFDGEVYDGDLVMFKVGGEWTEPRSFDSLMGDQIQAVKQGRLHAVSKTGYEVGEDVWDDHLRTYVRLTEELFAIEHTKKYFKVLGWLSLDAKWVKEGDEIEIDEDEFRGCSRFDKTWKGKGFCRLKCTEDCKYPLTKFKVKCKCCGDFK